MHSSIPIILASLYVGIYYAIAYGALRKLRSVDPDYYVHLGGKPGFGMADSLAIGKMLFDHGVPKVHYPASVGKRILMARWMLFLSPMAFIVIVAMQWLVG